MSYTLLLGDCIEVMRGLPSGSVQTCVTSPPYYGLRDYQTATWEGGDAECDHKRDIDVMRAVTRSSTLGGGKGNQEVAYASRETYHNTCGKCGARRIDNQIGLEESPEAYVARLVDVFREVRRVLRDDGTLWLNLGSSYASGGGPEPPQTKWQVDGASHTQNGGKSRSTPAHFKPKDMIPIPWMVAMALQQDGYYLRQDIIWHKPNPMPESVTDRPTKAHEYIFLLSKSREYYYDSDAVAERATQPLGKPRRTGQHKSAVLGHTNSPTTGLGTNQGAATRNRRSVWTVATKPYKGSHFAVFPEALIEPCILAGSAVGDTVLDPFNGSGTTGAVALKHGRKYVGIDLNADYIELAHQRIRQAQPLLLPVT